MSQVDQAQELFELLFGELRDRLWTAGWRPMGQPDAGALDFAFIKQLRGDFAATCSVLRAAPDEVPISILDVLVGVSYEPLRNSSCAASGPLRWCVIHASATDEESLKLVDEIDWDEDEENGPEDDGPLFRIGSGSEVPAVAEAISDIVVERAVPFAERRADLEVLIRELADPDDPEFVDIRVPMLLAASGRFDEARAELDRWQPAPELLAGRQLLTAQKLRGWIDSHEDQ